MYSHNHKTKCNKAMHALRRYLYCNAKARFSIFVVILVLYTCLMCHVTYCDVNNDNLKFLQIFSKLENKIRNLKQENSELRNEVYKYFNYKEKLEVERYNIGNNYDECEKKNKVYKEHLHKLSKEKDSLIGNYKKFEKQNKEYVKYIQEFSEPKDVILKKMNKCREWCAPNTKGLESSAIRPTKKLLELNVNFKPANTTRATSQSEPSLSFYILSYRITNQLKEMWYYWRGAMKKKQNMLPSESLPKNDLELFRELQQTIEIDFEELISMNGVKEKKEKIANDLSKDVQKRLIKLQSPVNCRTSKLLVLRQRYKRCGYGCMMHYLIRGLIIAYATERTLVLDTPYITHNTTWSSLFQSLNYCLHVKSADVKMHMYGKHQESDRLVEMPAEIESVAFKRKLPMAVPKDLYENIQYFHARPFLWWVGQICKYVFQKNPKFDAFLSKKRKEIGFEKPIVGIHVRRTDKVVREAKYYLLRDYMYWVELYYKKIEINGKAFKKRVFIASDDPKVIIEARQSYPEYEFFHDSSASNSANDPFSRYKEESLHGIISDIDMLSDSDFLVCTFSSQVCRLAFEIMNHKHTDASQKFRSLDDIYYYGGGQANHVRVIRPFTAKAKNEISLHVGDILSVTGNHWDGQSYGRNILKDIQGLFPSYKVEPITIVEDFPTFT